MFNFFQILTMICQILMVLPSRLASRWIVKACIMFTFLLLRSHLASQTYFDAVDLCHTVTRRSYSNIVSTLQAVSGLKYRSSNHNAKSKPDVIPPAVIIPLLSFSGISY
ncbi:MAG: hypothetical protein HC763_04090 [Hydrococcus sp. CRU_1_1]|nr:hypothetical protein [Hydrococcus sp. CRU_1_1]